MKAIFLYIISGCIFTFSGFASTPVVNDLLPRPQQFEVNDGVLDLMSTTWHICITAPASNTGIRLQERMKETLSDLGFTGTIEYRKSPQITLSMTPSSGGDRITGKEIPMVADGLKEEAYTLLVSPKGVGINAHTEKGLFYGMMTLKQLIHNSQVRGVKTLACLQITDWPTLKMRGVSEEYGQDPLPTMEAHKRFIRILAQFKINTCLWHIDPDHFAYAFDPEIGRTQDRVRFEAIKEMVAYARQYYVEIIPTVEFLGHMEGFLQQDKYKQYGEMPGGGTELCPTSPEAFELVRKMVREIAPAFDGRYFHCGLAEACTIGNGRSSGVVKEKGIEWVLLNHYYRLNELLKSHNHSMMMYADIVLNHPKLLSLMPKDVLLMYFDYRPRDEYPGMTQLKENHLPMTALSGLGSWNNLYPLYVPVFRNMDSMVRQAVRDEAQGFFVSSWGGGHKDIRGFNELDLYGVVYGGAISWKPDAIPMAEYSTVLATHFFGSPDERLATALTRLAQCQGSDINRTTQACKLFCRDMSETVNAMANATEEDMAFWRNLQQQATETGDTFASITGVGNEDYLKILQLAANRLKCAADMAFEGRALAVDRGKADINREQHALALEDLAKRHQLLREQYDAVWRTTNRPVNLEKIDQMLKTATESLQALAGKVRSGAF